jgi:hypothetical protein
LTFSGGTQIGTSASGNTVTMAIASGVTTLSGTQTLTNKTFTSPTIDSFDLGSSTISGLGIGANGIIIEGATADDYETTLTAQDPTQDNIITIPDSTMTAITTATHATKSSVIARALALG